MKPCRDKYREELISQGIPEAKLRALEVNCETKMEEAYGKSKSLTFTKEQWMTEEWAKIKKYEKFDYGNATGVDAATFNKIGKLITHLPKDGGKFHPQIVKIFDAREKSIDEGKGIDWGTAEALAFATLID
jgi:2-oxoglutarate dehydrogenase E1 component